MALDHIEDFGVEVITATKGRLGGDVTPRDGSALCGAELALAGSELVSHRINEVRAGLGRVCIVAAGEATHQTTADLEGRPGQWPRLVRQAVVT